MIPTHDALIALYLYRGESIAQLAQLAELAFFEMEPGSDGQLATWAHWTARANWNGGRSWMAGPAIVVFPTAPGGASMGDPPPSTNPLSPWVVVGPESVERADLPFGTRSLDRGSR